jgi:hypothetical protein
MKVAIIGKARGWEDAPCEGETWGITQLILRRDVSRVIDMNDYSLWGKREAQEAIRARNRARELNVLYVDLESYPLKEVVSFFGTDYFSNTVDYALALAVFEGFTQIDLYGVNMTAGTEYIWQKPGIEFWVGMAKGRGVEVNVCGNILKTVDRKLYGYGTLQKG